MHMTAIQPISLPLIYIHRDRTGPGFLLCCQLLLLPCSSRQTIRLFDTFTRTLRRHQRFPLVFRCTRFWPIDSLLVHSLFFIDYSHRFAHIRIAFAVLLRTLSDPLSLVRTCLLSARFLCRWILVFCGRDAGALANTDSNADTGLGNRDQKLCMR